MNSLDQTQLPGMAEYCETARRWVAARVNHPDAQQVIAELWNAAILDAPDLVLVTVVVTGRRIWIATYIPHRITLDALAPISQQILDAFAVGYGVTPDGAGLYAEIEIPRR